MAFNIALIKEHPYGTGGVVIIGGLFVFYLMSKNGGTNQVAATSSDGGYLAANTALGEAQAAAAIQTNAQKAAIQQASINASAANHQVDVSAQVANTQTIASLLATLNQNKSAVEVTQSNNEAATLQNKNTLQSQENIYSIQEQGLIAQINEAENMNANNNATSLSALQSQLDSQTYIASQYLDSATTLAVQQEEDYQSNVKAIIPNVGKKYNSALDANNANAAYLTILAGGNPNVAQSGVYSSASTANSAAFESASKVNSVVSGVSNVASTILHGLFA